MKPSATTAAISNNHVRARLRSQIKGLEFDILTLRGGINGETRNAKYIKDLTKVLKEYKELYDRVPANDDTYVRPAQ
jgi:hypothetical protein